VAVDWIAASKMGIDPMISPYMKLAVGAFGKPEISLSGIRIPIALAERAVALTCSRTKGRREPLLREPHVLGHLANGRDALRHKEPDVAHAAASENDRPMRRAFFLRTGKIRPLRTACSVRCSTDGFLMSFHGRRPVSVRWIERYSEEG